ncbi:PAS domain S-box protein [bacterium]|nr:PAS domain S-box protein [bacterium]
MTSQQRVLILGNDASTADSSSFPAENVEIKSLILSDPSGEWLDRIKAMGPDRVVMDLSMLENLLRNASVMDGTRRQLEESERRFRRIADRLSDGILVSENGRLVYTNSRACEIFGISYEELTGLRGADLVAPEDQERVALLWRESEQRGEFPPSIECWFLRKDGERRFIHSRIQRFRDSEASSSLLMIVNDVTENKLAEIRLLESEEKFRNLAEQSPNMIFINRAGKVAYANRLCEERMGYTREQFYSPEFDFLSLIAPEDRDRITQNIRQHWQGRELEPYRYGLVTAGGERIEALITTKLITYEKQPAILGIITDITALVSAEATIRGALREKELLIKEIHHRVKNNMQVISSLLRIQSAGVTDRRCLAVLKEAQERVRVMSLVYEKLYQSENLVRIDFSEYLRSLVLGLQSAYPVTRKIRLQFGLESVALGLDQAVPCGLIVNELVSNVYKHAFPPSRKGDACLRIGLKRTAGRMLELTVRDNGTGISKRTDPRKTKSFGLYLVRLLVQDQLGGTLGISRSRGTTFRIRFRIAAAEDSDSRMAPDAETAAADCSPENRGRSPEK